MSTNQPFIVSRIDEDPQVLRDRFQEWGYLHIKNYVGADQCNALMNDFLAELDPHIAFDDASQLPVLKSEPFGETDALWDEVYPKMQSLESFHSFFHQPPIIELMKKISDDEVFVYPIKMARISTPRNIGFETPPHQDAPRSSGCWDP